MNDDSKQNDLTGFDLIDIVQMRDCLTWKPYRFDRVTGYKAKSIAQHNFFFTAQNRDSNPYKFHFFCQGMEIHRTQSQDLYIGMN